MSVNLNRQLALALIVSAVVVSLRQPTVEPPSAAAAPVAEATPHRQAISIGGLHIGMTRSEIRKRKGSAGPSTTVEIYNSEDEGVKDQDYLSFLYVLYSDDGRAVHIEGPRLEVAGRKLVDVAESPEILTHNLRKTVGAPIRIEGRSTFYASGSLQTISLGPEFTWFVLHADDDVSGCDRSVFTTKAPPSAVNPNE